MKKAFTFFVILIVVMPLMAASELSVYYKIEDVPSSAWKIVPPTSMELGDSITGEKELSQGESANNTFYAVVKTSSQSPENISLTVTPLDLVIDGTTYYYPMTVAVESTTYEAGESGGVTPVSGSTVNRDSVTINTDAADINLNESAEHVMKQRLVSNKVTITLGSEGDRVAGKYDGTLTLKVDGQ